MISESAVITSTKPRRKPGRKPKIQRPILEPARIYTRREGALALGVSEITMIRARDAGHLAEFRVGRYVRHSGQQLLDWLAAGGRTS
ncbi:MAG TPA: hypothetical protein VFV58_34770 [Blastocatellia bacterium]|jgi:hypothetical protein|nr:hypothetical protein [Blastocatellia bacterium]